MRAVEWLSPKGPIAGKLDHFESRPQQNEMVRAVGAAFEKKEHLIVEAGTGVGKSFAYLLPAIERVTQHGERVVISTRTIALQEQLIHKDIPFLQSALPCDFTAELVKGRNNYVGLRRLAMASGRQESLFPDGASREALWGIEDWALQTKDGSLSDLPVQPSRAVWDRVRSEHDNCMGRRCPHYSRCFFQRARRRAEDAGLLVVNHALFFSDIALRSQGGGLLPDYDLVVLDEAHSVEDVACDHFGVSVSDAQIHYLLNSLCHERTGRGALAGWSPQSAVDAVQHARRATDSFFRELVDWQQRCGRTNGRLKEPPAVQNTISPILGELAGRLRELRSEVKDEDRRFELTSLIERAVTLADQLRTLLAHEHEDWVYWLESREAGRKRATLGAKPIDVAEMMRAMLLDRVGSVVFTSATISTGTNDGFSYFRERIGFKDGGTLKVGSPFDYASQMTVRVNGSLPDPSDGSAFVAAACDAMRSSLQESDGRALVLFTSYKMLNDCAQQMEPFFEQASIPLLVQGGELSRTAMLEEFRRDVRSVIFGTDSFWEGVDVVGEALSSVIIVKLPFLVPDRPDVEARIERIKLGGGDPFRTFQLPAAILKFKQGVGRLIRTKRDRGTIVVLDPRIASRFYGRMFLGALPRCPIVHAGDAC